MKRTDRLGGTRALVPTRLRTPRLFRPRVRLILFAYTLLLPLLAVMAALVFYPAALTFVDSFRNINLITFAPVHFVGLDNYRQLFTDSTVVRTITNTGFYLVIASVGELVLGLIFALALRNAFRARGVILAIALLPWALPPVVDGVIWGWIYNPTYGVLNGILKDLHVISTYQVWLAGSWSALFFVVLVHIWKMVPLATVIILAALQSISGDLYEAGRIDGGGPGQLFRHITLPLIRPALAIVLSQSTIGAINLFDEAYVLTGTSLDTRSALIQDYLITFRDLNLSLGMALSFVITFATIVVTVLFAVWLYRGNRTS